MNELLRYKAIGFDLDGTIYDEYDFIEQAYRSVACVLSKVVDVDNQVIYKDLCHLWLEFGSSSNIFQKALNIYSDKYDEETIQRCVECYRNAEFELNLSKRAIMIFEYLTAMKTNLFIVTDGNSDLQRKKIEKLGLYRWFLPENIAISGDYGADYQKPSSFMANKINVLQDNLNDVVYLGDRNIDRMFAENCGFKFFITKNMMVLE